MHRTAWLVDDPPSILALFSIAAHSALFVLSLWECRGLRHAPEKLLIRPLRAEPAARPVSVVPWSAKAILALALLAQISWQTSEPKLVALASALGKPTDVSWFRVISDGEPIGLAQMLVLYLQAFDNQPGISVPFRDLDYGAVEQWLSTALELDPVSQYPVMLAAQVYAQVPDEGKQRQMLDFVHREFLRDPEKRWRWLAHAAIIAKHRLKDMPLALQDAEDITRHAKSALGWARQMRIFILEDMEKRKPLRCSWAGCLRRAKSPTAQRFTS